MLIARTIAQVQIGGDGSDNPVPFGDANFDFDQTQLQFSRRRVVLPRLCLN